MLLHDNDDIAMALEFRLSTRDVANILHVTPRQVYGACELREGQQILPLKFRTFGAVSTKHFCLSDVRSYARARDWKFDLREIPPSLARIWGIDTSDNTDYVDSDERIDHEHRSEAAQHGYRVHGA